MPTAALGRGDGSRRDAEQARCNGFSRLGVAIADGMQAENRGCRYGSRDASNSTHTLDEDPPAGTRADGQHVFRSA
jgi:hypothetical protein